MSQLTNEVSRRDFLKNAATLSGGLTIALYLPGCSKPEQAIATNAVATEVAANAWLHVTADGSINSADISLVKSKSGTGLP